MFNSRLLRWIAVVTLGAAALGCSSPPPEPSPGVDEPVEPLNQGTYIGSWRQSVPDGWSTITISEGPDGPWFSWTAENQRETVRCDQPGVCRSYGAGEAQVEYRFRTFKRPDSPFLFVECQGTPLTFEAGGAIRYVDRLELRARGEELWAHTIEAEGFTAKPPVKLTRIANAAP